MGGYSFFVLVRKYKLTVPVRNDNFLAIFQEFILLKIAIT